MIQRSQLAHGKGRQKVKYVKCPVCSKPLTLSDLKHDPTVLRRVKRKIAEDQERREAGLGADEGDTDEEMQDVDEEVVVRRRSQVSKVKKEEIEERERSMVPGTQFDSIPDADDMTQ